MVRLPDTHDHLGDIQRLQQQLEQQIRLRKTIQHIRQGLDTNDVYQAVIQGTQDFLQADWGVLFKHDLSKWQLIGASSHVPTLVNAAAIKAYLELGPIAIQLQQPFPIAVCEQSVQCIPGYEQRLNQLPGSWLLLPVYLPHVQSLQAISQPWGLLAIGRQDPKASWTIEEKEQSKILVDEIAIALNQSFLFEKLKQDTHKLQALALTDSLTGLANRRQFDSYFDAEWQRLAREQQPLTLILCDIDYFKRYNDYYGHPMGDTCLAQVSQSLRLCIRRPADLVARYGGEEFAVVLPNTDTEGGHSVALAIQQQLKKAAIPHATSNIASEVTLTMGIATVVPEHQLASQDLLQAADLALYHAKQQGRDRIYVHAHYYVNSSKRSDQRGWETVIPEETFLNADD